MSIRKFLQDTFGKFSINSSESVYYGSLRNYFSKFGNKFGNPSFFLEFYQKFLHGNHPEIYSSISMEMFLNICIHIFLQFFKISYENYCWSSVQNLSSRSLEKSNSSYFENLSRKLFRNFAEISSTIPTSMHPEFRNSFLRKFLQVFIWTFFLEFLRNFQKVLW